MQYFTVKMTQLHLISIFDGRGKKTGERREELAVTLTDLPLQTAQMYREKNKDGNVQIIAQPSLIGDAKRAGAGQYASKPRSYDEPVKKKSGQVTGHAKPSKTTAVQNAARTGDLTAAINQR